MSDYEYAVDFREIKPDLVHAAIQADRSFRIPDFGELPDAMEIVSHSITVWEVRFFLALILRRPKPQAATP
jgi:hypothetical protein